MFATSTIGAAIMSVTSDVTTTGGTATTLVLGVWASLLVLGYFVGRMKRRGIGASKF